MGKGSKRHKALLRPAFLGRQQIKSWAWHHTVWHREISTCEEILDGQRLKCRGSEPSKWDELVRRLTGEAVNMLDNSVCMCVFGGGWWLFWHWPIGPSFWTLFNALTGTHHHDVVAEHTFRAHTDCSGSLGVFVNLDVTEEESSWCGSRTLTAEQS